MTPDDELPPGAEWRSGERKSPAEWLEEARRRVHAPAPSAAREAAERLATGKHLDAYGRPIGAAEAAGEEAGDEE